MLSGKEQTISFRKATQNDVDLAVPLIYSSGSAVCEYMLHDAQKGPAQNFLKYAFVKAGGESGYDNHICIAINNEVVGVGAIWSGKKSAVFMWSEIKKVMSYYGFIRGIKVLIRGLRVEMLIRPPKKNEWALAHLGIHPKGQGIGLGTKLINHLIEQVSIASNEKVILDVSFINPKAQKLYERLGFKVSRKNSSKLHRKKLNVKVPGHNRMER